MAKKAILTAGIRFDPKDIDVSAIRKTLVQSVGQAKVAAARAGGGRRGSATAGGQKNIATETKKSIQFLKDYHSQVSQSDKATINYLKLLKQGAGGAEEFGAKIGQITTRFGAYLVSLKALFAIQRAFNESLEFIFKFDDALQDLQKVLKATPQGLEDVTGSLFKLAQATGNSVTQVAESFNVFIRTGQGVTKALEQTNAALIAVNISELNVTDSTKLVTSTMRVFGDELRNEIEALDILSVTADNAATSAGEIGRAVLRSGAAAQAVGVSYRELNAIVAATEEATKLGGARIGSALKTIFARIAANSKQLRDQANALGANIQVGDGVVTVFRKLEKIYGNLNKEQKTQIAQIVSGKRRFTEFNAIISSFGKTEVLLEKQLGAAGTAAAKNEIELQKLSTQATQAAATFAEFISSLTGLGRGAEGIGSIRDLIADTIGIVKLTGDGLNELLNITEQWKVDLFGISSIFKTLIKVGIFAFGIPKLKRIITGFKEFIGLGKLARQSLTQMSTAQGQVLQKVQQTNVARDQSVTKIVQEIRALKEMNAIMGRVVEKQKASAGRGGFFTGLLGRVKSTAAKATTTDSIKAIGAGAVLVGVQVVGDGLRRLGKEFEDQATNAGAANAAMARAGATAAELGTTFALMLGPAKGLIAGLLVFGTQIAINAVKTEKANRAFLDQIEKAEKNVVTFGEASEVGGELAKQAFVELAGSTGEAANAIFSQSVITARALEISKDRFVGLAAQLDRMATTIQAVESRLAGVGRATDLRNELRKAFEDIRRKQLGFQFDIQTGPVSAQFANVKRVIVESKTALESVVGEIQNAADFTFVLNQAQKAHEAALNDTSKTAREIVEEYGLQSQTLLKIIDEQTAAKQVLEDQFSIVSETVDKNQALADALQKTVDRQKAGIETLKKQEKSIEVIDATQRSIERSSKEIERINQQITRSKQQQKELTSQIAEATGIIEKQSKRDLKTISQAVIKYQQIAKEAQNSAKAIEAGIKKTQVGTELSKLELDVRKQMTQQQLNASTLAEKDAVNRKRLVNEELLKLKSLVSERENEIRVLAEREGFLRKAGKFGLAEQVKAARVKLEQAATKELLTLAKKAEIEVDVKLQIQAGEKIKQREQALLDFRLNAIDHILQREEQSAQRRIQFIEELGQTAAGRQFLQEEFRPSQFMEREFGLVGGIIVNELDKATEQAVAGMVERLETLKKSGIDAFQLLQEAQATRAAIEEKIDDATFRKREILINKVKDATDEVAKAEQKLVQERNKLPELNAKVIDAQKNLGTASKGVDDAMTNLRRAMSAASDAQADLAFNTLKAAHDARVATGSLGARGALGGLSSIFNQIVNTANVSGQKLLEIRAQLAKEELSIVQGQFNTVKGLGVEAATASADQFAKIQEGLGVAGAIAGGADVGRFTPDQIGEALKRKDLFEGVERRIAEFGLKELGLSADLLQTTESQMVRLAEISAQTGQAQVNAANSQVLAAQQELIIAEENRAVAKEELKVSINQLAVQESIVAAAHNTARVSALGFDQIALSASKQLSILNENRIATEQLGGLLQTVDNSIKNSTKEIVSSLSAQLAKIGSSLAARSSAGVPIPTVAGGSLNAGEFSGLMSAAKFEKRAMPAGSKLMLANTSETVLTRRQSKNLGLKSLPKRFAANGNAVSTDALTTAVGALINKLNEPGLVNQNINVQVDTERNVNVRGLDAIDGAMRRAFEEKTKQFAPREEQDAIGGIVTGLVEKLSELGVINSRGV
jgi:TP901 family phage tail tape measure protein